MPADRELRSDRLLAAGWFLFALAVLAPLLTVRPAPAPDDAIVASLGEGVRADLARAASGLFYDDGFYYLQIARQLAAGAGSSFDGLHPTNGYQPLWLLCLLPLALIFESQGGLALAALALQALLAATTCVVVYCGARMLVGRLGASFAVLFWMRLQHTYYMAWSGMEYGVHALVVASLILLLLRRHRGGQIVAPGSVFLLGVLAALAFLARIDNALLAVAVAASLWWWAPKQCRLRDLLLFVAPVLATILVYLAANLWLFGHALPVSGAVKALWSAEILSQDPIYLEHGWLLSKIADSLRSFASFSRSGAAGLLLGSVGAVVSVGLGRAALGRASAVRALAPAAAFAVVHLLVYAAVFHGGRSLKPWYYVIQPLLASMVVAWWFERGLGALAARLPGWRRARLAAGLIAAAGLLISIAVNVDRRRDRLSDYGSEPLYVAAGWARSHLPPAALVGAWNAGTVGFFSQRVVVNLDGLVNSWEFFRTDRSDLCAYLERIGIDYLVDSFQVGHPFEFYSRELGPCVEGWERIWQGPTHPGSEPLWGSMVFRLPPAKGS